VYSDPDMSDSDYGDFEYISDARVDAARDSPLVEGAEQDRLHSLRLFSVAARTWPYIRPEIKHLAALSIIYIVLALTGYIFLGLITDIYYNHLIGTDPLSERLGQILSLEATQFRDVAQLSPESRVAVRTALFKFIIVVVCILAPATFAVGFYYMWVRQRINQNLRVRMMSQVQNLSLRFHASTQTGDAIYRVYQDSAMVTNIIQLLLDAARDLFQYMLAIIMLYLFAPNLVGMLICVTISVGLMCRLMSSPMRMGFRWARETNSRLTSRIQTSVASAKVVKANVIEKEEFERFKSEQQRAFSAAHDARSRWSRFGIYNFTLFAVGLLTGESYMALLSFLGVPTYSTATIFSISIGFTLWNLGAFRFAIGRFGDSGIENLILRWGRFQEMSVGLDRAFEVLDLEPEVADAEDAIELKDIDPRVVFENVSFSYQPDQPTLQDINLTAMPGAVTAIVGPTGSGKSTLMMLLLRLFDPDEGIVRVGGRNIQEFTVNSLRANVAIALQENILFSTSIKENIRYAVSDATDEEVYEAARITDAEGFILDQKFGYNTELGERGARLSTGQRQRLSIARAVLKNTPILILDEPTAALDAVTESRVMHNLSQWGSNRVIFLITHRLSTIRQADQIIYVRNGRITEVGSHEALLKKEGGGYRRFVELEESLMTANIE